ncbi:nose resistant to fluoxetine protein 6 isoform X1 [Leptinotarsa decemlineata]|uniref:nose resistant to fluoxetine protein 6 isoform X1 n=1 Tax=Leptinotarsa decemlineata TaxID=7539 RepID=UPI003D309203
MKTSIHYIVVLLLLLVEIYGNIILETVQNEDKKASLTEECRSTLELYSYNWKNSSEDDSWALKMWDSSTKIPVGLLSYDSKEMGNFMECVETKSKSNEIFGKYCLGSITATNISCCNATNNNSPSFEVQVHLEKLLTLAAPGFELYTFPTWAICIPRNCTDSDVQVIMSNLQEVGVTLESLTCQTIDDVYPQLTTGAVIGITILSVIVAAIGLSTCYDVYCHFHKKDFVQQMFRALSIYTNSGKIFQMKKENSGQIGCLTGIRVISTIWIVIGHTRHFYVSGPIVNSKDAVTDNFILMKAVAEHVHAVDTFLMIGGVLVTYVFFKQKRYEKSFKIVGYYIHRYVRLTSPLAGLVLFSATLVRYTGSGPLWNTIIERFGNNCSKYWWSTLLYIQNYYNVDNMCLPHTWYLNVDMQLFLISPIILYLLKTRPKTAITILGFASLASISAGLWSVHQLVDKSNLGVSSEVFFNNYYLKTHSRAEPWLIGTIFGYLFAGDLLKPRKIPKTLLIPIWAACFTVMTMCVFGDYFFSNDLKNSLWNVLFVVLRKSVWCICLAWIIWACTANRKGILNIILSNSVFQFLDQFSYSIYLLHHVIVNIIVFSQKIPYFYTAMNVVYSFCGIYMFSLGLSVIWVLIFEIPIIVLQKNGYSNANKII